MSTPTLYNDLSLAEQAAMQREQAWDLERDIPWGLGVDPKAYLLPLDQEAIAFPGVSAQERLALSQLMGVVINATIAEMEGVIDSLRDIAWEAMLERFPVNPEMRELGHLFFEEERKHAAAFKRYNARFCDSLGLDPLELDRLLPKAFGSRFLSAIRLNAEQGGFAFWWVVAGVEEVSIQIYQMMHKHEASLDPLYFCVHRKHLEDEARHRNYAFLMLELAHGSPATWKERCVRKTDLVLAQVMTAGWVMAELHRIYTCHDLARKHPFFKTLSTCLPKLGGLKPWEVVRRLFVTAPYISFVLNTNHHRQTVRYADRFKVWRLPLPKPRVGKLFTGDAPA